MFSFFLLDFLFMKLNEEKWKRPFSKFTFNRHQHKMSIRQQWKNDRGSKGWRSGESNRPPVLWPGLQILASKRYVSGSLPCSKTYSFCRFPDFPLSLKTDTQHSMWKAWARLHKFFTTSKCFVAKKNPNLQFYIRPQLRMDSFGKPKRRDEAKEISFKKFQNVSHQARHFCHKTTKASVCDVFISFYGTDNREVITKFLRDLRLPTYIWPYSLFASDNFNWNSCIKLYYIKDVPLHDGIKN